MKKIIVMFFLLTGTLTMFAQNHTEALRYSMLGFGGTARYMGVAGAMGAMGADFSALSTNPASIGLYRSSEITFSPSLFYSIAESKYNGTFAEDDKYNFNIGNAGGVFTFNNPSAGSTSKWQKFQFAFGYNRLANYNDNVSIAGDNPWNSIMTEFSEKATGVHPFNLNQFDTRLAWDTYLFKDTVRDNNGILHYISVIPDGGVYQMKFIETRGSYNEMTLTLGGNFNDRLYIGGTLGLPTINYRENTTYREFDKGDSIPVFKSLTLDDYLNTTGNGINFKLGIIARPFDWVRIGGAIHTPTFFTMRDSYGRTLVHYRDGMNSMPQKSDDGYFDYSLHTPLRAMVNVGFLIGKYAFIGLDYEFVDYSESRLDSKRENFYDVNNTIRESFESTSNIRVGGELNLHPIKLRAGYALNGSPYKDDINDFEKRSLTFGLGFSDQNYFIDFAWVMNTFSENYYLYNPKYVNAAIIDHSSTNMIMTLGFKF